MASLSAMRAAVAEQQSINAQLRAELNTLELGISQASHKWNELTNYINGTLQNGTNRMNHSHDMMLQAYEVQLEIEKMFERYKRIELANKKIRACNNRIYYDFANYNAVRKVVRALLDNVETNYVSSAALTKAVEVKHLQLPDYWLTCALLAVMAWQNNDRPTADRALARAYKLDKKNTAMFLFALNLRLGRDSAALLWFTEYVACARTGEDQSNVLLLFAIANKTIEQECSDAVVSKMQAFIDTLIKEDMARSGYSEEELVARIRRYHTRWRSSEDMAYPLLINYCTEHAELNELLTLAKVNRKVLEFILETNTVTAAERNSFLNSFIEEVIDRKNSEEIGVVKEIKYNELIIKHGGELEPAQEEYQAWLRHNENEFEMITEMVDWVYDRNDVGEDINPTVKKTMFTLVKRLIRQAVDADVAAYRQRHRHVRGIRIGEYESPAANLASAGSEDGKIDQYFHDKAERLAAEQKIWPSFIFFGVGALAAVGAIALSAPALLVVTGAGAIGGVIKILMTNKNKKRIHEQALLDATNVKKEFARLSVEYLRFNAELMENDAFYTRITEELEKA